MSFSGSRRRMAATQGGACPWCELPLADDLSDVAVDHIIPRCWGGPDVSWNRQLLHFKCNGPGGKGDKLTDEARQLAELRGITLRRTEPQPAVREVAIPRGVVQAGIHALRRADLEVDEDVIRVIIIGILPAVERHVRREITKTNLYQHAADPDESAA